MSNKNQFKHQKGNNKIHQISDADVINLDGSQMSFQDSQSSVELIKLNTPSKDKNRIYQIVFDVIAILIILIVFLLIYTLVNPNISYFYCNDTDVMYPYKSDTVALWVLALYGTLAPIIFILFVELKNSGILLPNYSQKNLTQKAKVKSYLICIFHAISLFALGIVTTLLITEIGKRWIGRLRPHFMEICQPNYSLLNCTSSGSPQIYTAIYTGDSFCTGDAAKIKEARLSFPSGHSSFSCFTMLFLILYLEARLSLLRFRYVKSLIQLIAFIAAFTTCVSRVSDYHHRGTDVIGGVVIGLVIGLFITLVTGRVLWQYKNEEKVYEFDMER